MPGAPPTQAAVDRLLGRLHQATPDTGADLELGIGRMRVLMTLHASDAAHAAALATAAVGAVLARKPTSIDVRPAT